MGLGSNEFGKGAGELEFGVGHLNWQFPAVDKRERSPAWTAAHLLDSLSFGIEIQNECAYRIRAFEGSAQLLDTREPLRAPGNIRDALVLAPEHPEGR